MRKTTRWPIAALLGLLTLAGSGPLSGCATAASKARAKHQVAKARSHFEIGADHLYNGRDAEGLREMLIAESFHTHIPKGYVYFAMGFSVFVEALNIRVSRHSKTDRATAE